MQMPEDAPLQPDNNQFWIGYARAMAGALIFAFPLLMTMEMWWLGMYLERHRLALFIVVLLPILIGLSRYSGFRETTNWYDDVVDGLVAFSAGVLTSAIFLALFAVLDPGMSWNEIIGKIAVLAFPASIGAIVAGKQLGETENDDQKRRARYGGELFIMVTGALFIAFNVAPTEEIILIAYKMSGWHAIALVLTSLLIMHACVYALNFRGRHVRPENVTVWRLALHFTVAGYAIAVLVSAYVLWTFGRFDGLALERVVMVNTVLAFPAAFGAALARLVV
ncbi:MAG TPA: TIGR02587 family membrane protein [Gammaproteobacteria bacterium]